MSSASASRNVIGTISRTVVRLSRNADSTAVVVASETHDGERPPARELAGADREPRVDAGRLGHLDHQHHPGEQPERVPVDRLDRDLLIDRLREQHQHGAEQRDLGAIHPLGGDHHQRRGEQRDGERHQPSSRSCSTVRVGQRPRAGACRAGAGRAANREHRLVDAAGGVPPGERGAPRAASPRARWACDDALELGELERATSGSSEQSAALGRSQSRASASGEVRAIQAISRRAMPPMLPPSRRRAPWGGVAHIRRGSHHPRSGLDEAAADRVARQLDAVAHPELGQHVLAVALDGLGADRQQLRDLLGRVRLGDQLDDLELARRQRIARQLPRRRARGRGSRGSAPRSPTGTGTARRAARRGTPRRGRGRPPS